MKSFVPTALILTLAAVPAYAHYAMIIPSDNMLSQEDGRSIDLTLSFFHPFEGKGMTLDKPASFSVTHAGRTTELLDQLTETTVKDEAAFGISYDLDRPGTYVFALTPQAYWEPEEDAFITHYTKTYVSAYGDDEGWDTELVLKTEIVPLTKPFALWAGNVFQGIVKLDGEAVPHAEVEVEYYNEDGSAQVPSDLMITQTIKADANGVFTYAVPESGWWGFAALNTAEPMQFDGEDKDHELGAVIWVHFEPWAR